MADKKSKFNPLLPDNQVETSNVFMADTDVKVVGAKYAVETFTGKNFKTGEEEEVSRTVAQLTVVRVDDEEEKEYELPFGVGKCFNPSDDEEYLAPAEGFTEETAKLNRGTKWAKFINSMLEAGMNPDRLDLPLSEMMTGYVLHLEGREEQMKFKGEKKSVSHLIVTRIIEEPGEQQKKRSASKAAPAPAKKGKPAPEPEPEDDDDSGENDPAALLVEMISDSGPTKRALLSSRGTVWLKNHGIEDKEERSEILSKWLDEKWLANCEGIAYDVKTKEVSVE